MLPARSGCLIVPLTFTSTLGCSFNDLDVRDDFANESQIVVGPFERELERSIIGDAARLHNLTQVKRHPTRQDERMNIRLLYLSVGGQYFVRDANGEITICGRQTRDAGRPDVAGARRELNQRISQRLAMPGAEIRPIPSLVAYPGCNEARAICRPVG